MLLSDNKQILHLGKFTNLPILSQDLSSSLSVISFDTKKQIQKLKTKNQNVLSLIKKYLRITNCQQCPIFEKVYSGKDYVFLQTSLKQIWAYGNFDDGLLGIGIERINLPIPLKISLLGFPKLSDIKISHNKAIALTKHEQLYSWGVNTFDNYFLQPKKVQQPISVVITKISHSKFTSYQISKDCIYAVYNKQLFCFNDSQRDLKSKYNKIVFPINKSNIKGVSCGKHHILSWDQDGKVYGWGDSRNGRLGRLSGLSKDFLIPNPFLIEQLKQEFIINTKCGTDHGLALTKNGTVFQWGNQYVTSIKGKHQFNRFTFKSKILDIYAHDSHSACLNIKGQVYHWGHHEIQGLEIEHYPTTIPQLKNYIIKHLSLSQNSIVCVRQQQSCLKSKSQVIIQKSMKGINKSQFMKQMVLGDINVYKLQDNFMKSPIKSPLFLQKEKRSRPNTSKNYIKKVNRYSQQIPQIFLDNTWKTQNQKLIETIKKYQRKSLIKINKSDKSDKFDKSDPPTKQILKQSVQILRHRYMKKNVVIFQPVINSQLSVLQKLICVLNKQCLCHFFNHILKKNKQKLSLQKALLLQKYFVTLKLSSQFQNRPNIRENHDFCLKQVLQSFLIKSLKNNISNRIQFYKNKIKMIHKQINIFYKMSKQMKKQLGIMLDYEILINCRINKTAINPNLLKFMAFVKNEMQHLKNYDFKTKRSILIKIKQPQIIVKVRQKFHDVLPIYMFSKNSTDIVTREQSKFIHQLPQFRKRSEQSGRQQLINFMYKINIVHYFNQLQLYFNQKVLFIKNNMEQIMLQKARLLLTGKSKTSDTIVSFHNYNVPREILAIALNMKNFPKLPHVQLKLTVNQSQNIEKAVFNRYIQLVSKKVSQAKAKKRKS